MALNPYATHLGSRNAREVIAETPTRLYELIANLGASANQTPAPGKWSAREIACHLADCEVVFAFRLRQAIAEDGHVVQPFDQEKWAKNYASYDAGLALRVFSTLRGWNITFLSTVTELQLVKRFTHPERGEMSFQVLVETMAGHDLNHLKQVEAISAKHGATSATGSD